MNATHAIPSVGPLVLPARTAADLMTPNPISLRSSATVADATRLLTQHAFSAAPVIDDAGRPVGVLSQTDLLMHRLPVDGATDAVRVRDLMTPVVFSVIADTPVARLVQEMTALKVRRLFVVDADGILIGVVSALDLVRHLRP